MSVVCLEYEAYKETRHIGRSLKGTHYHRPHIGRVLMTFFLGDGIYTEMVDLSHGKLCDSKLT
jgi:hypothetical protein